MAFPTSLDDLSTTRATAGTDKLSSPDHLTHHAAEDTAIEAIEAKVGIKDSAVATSLDYFLRTGWINPGETWTRTGNHTFTVPGDQTAKYTKGTRVRYKDGGAWEYGAVFSSAYTTLTTVTLATNTDFAMAAATITDNFYSYVANPQGYPDWFNWTPTLTGGADLSGYTTAVFQITGQTCFFIFRAEAKNITTAGTVDISLPVAKSVDSTFSMQIHNGSAWIGHIHAMVTASVIRVHKTEGAGSWAGTETGVYIRLTGFYRIA